MLLKRLKYVSASLINCILNILPVSGPEQIVDNVPFQINLLRAKILVISLDQLGDAVMASVVPSALKVAYPEAIVDILIRPSNIAVFQNNPLVSTMVLDEAPWWTDNPFTKSLRPSYLRKLVKNIRCLRKAKYDVILDLRGDLRHILFFGAILQPKILLAHDKTGGEKFLSCRIPYNPSLHEIDKKLCLLKPLGIRAGTLKPKICLLPYEIRLARCTIAQLINDDRRPTVLIDPGAKPVQQWPVDRFAEVIRSLYDKFQNPVLISASPAYRGLAERLVKLVPPMTARLLPMMGVRELFAIVAICDLVISGDTGISHIASAVGTRTITLMGPTDPARFWHGVEGSMPIISPLRCSDELHASCSKSGRGKPGLCMMAIAEGTVIEAALKAVDQLKIDDQTLPKNRITQNGLI